MRLHDPFELDPVVKPEPLFGHRAREELELWTRETSYKLKIKDILGIITY